MRPPASRSPALIVLALLLTLALPGCRAGGADSVIVPGADYPGPLTQAQPAPASTQPGFEMAPFPTGSAPQGFAPAEITPHAGAVADASPTAAALMVTATPLTPQVITPTIPASASPTASATPSVTTVSPQAGARTGYEIRFVAFMVAQGGPDPLPWRRCVSEDDFDSPAARCPQISASAADFSYSASTRPGSVSIESGTGRVWLAPGGIVTAHYWIVDRGGQWWVSPTLEGRDLLPWCTGAGEAAVYRMQVYDLSQEPGYDPFLMDVLDYFENLPAGSLPAAAPCP
ncbi:MAG: hypothetical protein Kow00124_00660 [Anaerolineae bacterium]